MQSGFTPLLKSSRNHLRVLAIGCVATGGVAAFLLPGVAQSPAIVPTGDQSKLEKLPPLAPLPAMVRSDDAMDIGRAPVPQTRSLAQAQSEALKINIEFRDVPVAELIAMVAMQGDINISIGSDVDTEVKIPYIRLIDVTPSEAISKIAQSGGLQWKETKANEFYVGKVLPAALQGKAIQGTRSLSGGDNTWADITAAPQVNSRATQPGTPFEALVNVNRTSRRAEREIRPIRVRNVRPGIIAWWIDPEHQRKPVEFEQAEKNLAQNLDPYMLKSGVDPNVHAVLNNRNGGAAMPFATPYVPGAYQNPYANPVAAGYMNGLQPNYRVNNQFGNQGGGGGNNRGGGNNQGGNNSGGFGASGVLQLPQDAEGNPLVDQLVAIDSQNVLLVYGTSEGISKLQNIIDYLDRPIRQVEIEAQFIDVSVNDARGFGIQFSNGPLDLTDTNGDGEIDENDTPNNGVGAGVPDSNQLTISYGQYQARLNFLSRTGNSRIINSPRVTTMNNLSASLQSQQITPILLTSSTAGIGGQVGEEQQAFFLTTSVGLQVTPTINNDDTITVFMTPFVQSQVPTPGLTTGGTSTGDDDDNNSGGGSIPTVLAQSLTTVANVKDNDVIVLGGLRTRTESIVNSRIPILSRIPLIGKLFRTSNKNDTDRELVIFLTARIHRRAEDVTPIQGP